MCDRNAPSNDLLALRPVGEVATAAVLRKANGFNRALAELKRSDRAHTQQAMLIDSHMFFWTPYPPQEADYREGARQCLC